jgi:cyclin C
MDCCLVVYQPYRYLLVPIIYFYSVLAFHFYFVDRPLVQFVQDYGQEDQILPLSWKIVNDSLRTDISLMYPPYQIALG